jgi:predicted esterase
VPRGLSRSIATTIHGRYLADVPDQQGPHPLLVGFHGYGETAETHLEQLRRIPGSPDWVIVSVRALHLFYTKGGDVVGSWMTKLDRDDAVADNAAYVSAIVTEVKAALPVDGRLAFIGFSQGASMAYRAAARGGHPCQAVLAIAGDMPPEVADDALFRWPPVLITRGEQDRYFAADKMERDVAHLRGRGADVETVVFPGGHEWADPVFAAAGSLLTRVLRLD